MKKFLSLMAAALLSLCIVPFTACNDGRDGTNGTNGEDGVGIERVYINDDGELIVVLTDGKELNAGKTDIYEGLYYSEIIEEGEVTAYSVRSIGNLSTGKIEIPSTYKGKNRRRCVRLLHFAYGGNNSFKRPLYRLRRIQRLYRP